MKRQTAGITTSEQGGYIVKPAHSEENHVLALSRKKRTEKGIFVWVEL